MNLENRNKQNNITIFRLVLTVSLIAFLVSLIDQLTKQYILDRFEYGEVLEVIPGFFNLTLHFNPGVAFGFLAGLEDPLRTIILTLTTCIAVGFVVYLLMVDYRHDLHGQLALAMILGGAVGNIIDRVRLGQVVDFFDFYIGRAHWPTFNVADSAICVGVGLLLLKGVLDAVKARKLQITEDAKKV